MEPMRRQARARRAARGAVAASVATFVALLSHVTGGGEVPGAAGVVVPWALSFVVCTALAGRRLSAVRLGAAVAVSQVLFHTLFVLGSYDLGAAGHVHGGAALVLGTVSGQPIAPADTAMWVGHAVAALATTLALHRGERTLAVLRELAHRSIVWLRARADVLVAGVGPSPLRRMLAVVVAEARPVSPVLAASVRRRGPPVAAS